MEWLIIILIILAIAAIIYWFIGLAHMAPVLACVIAMVVVLVVYIIAHYILKRIYKQKSDKLASDSNPEIVSARKLDTQNQKINESNRIAALKKKQDDYQPKIEFCVKELLVLQLQHTALQKELAAMDCLADGDKNNKTVDYLIQQLENHRADSIKEALQQYDTMQEKEAQRAADRFRRQLAFEREEQRRQEERQHQLDMELEQIRHNRQVERELEQARKDEEWYRRYGS